MDLMNISQFDLYFLSRFVVPLLGAQASMLAPMVTPALCEAWAQALQADADLYRASMERLIRERAETSDAVNAIEQFSRDVTERRQLTASLARNAQPARRQTPCSRRPAGGWAPRAPSRSSRPCCSTSRAG